MNVGGVAGTSAAVGSQRGGNRMRGGGANGATRYLIVKGDEVWEGLGRRANKGGGAEVGAGANAATPTSSRKTEALEDDAGGVKNLTRICAKCCGDEAEDGNVEAAERAQGIAHLSVNLALQGSFDIGISGVSGGADGHTVDYEAVGDNGDTSKSTRAVRRNLDVVVNIGVIKKTHAKCRTERQALVEAELLAASLDVAGVLQEGIDNRTRGTRDDAVAGVEKTPPRNKSENENENGNGEALVRESFANVAATRQLFLEDTYLFECEGSVLASSETEVVLSATVFHPQGGGQPSDKGTITVGDSIFEVSGVRATARRDARVVHAGAWVRGNPAAAGVGAKCRVDAGYRRLCARFHSAGHAIDVAMTRSGTRLPPLKGYHFPDGGAYVEYEGSVPDAAGLVASLNAHLAAIVDENGPTRRLVDPRTGDRVVEIAGERCACGGTHVHAAGELGQVTVTKVKTKAKKLRVSYTVSSR
ncbi:hypothetical protein CTAYLR_003580 [Chrysophaeum taylorii]|uniref:Threonyl/alanyl tRNA synthetase SAD domain-containing protein n=1 Tax=Chrysophaeum taylorii TaxID=2483200 RepID=A0AAD7UL40_9STRA|nr:hypothetical protein CTAYLR_003580 [Chrysophaeum taylorii]